MTTTINDLHFDPQNARKRTERSADLLEQSLEELGFARSIVIDENGVILAGNGTVAAARELDMTNVQIVDTDGDTLIAVRRRGLTESQKKRLALLDNRTAELAEWDTAVLAELLEADPSMNDGMFDAAELEALLMDTQKLDPLTLSDDDTFDATPVAEGEPTRTSVGQYWALGKHRLYVGDCTDKDAVDRLIVDATPNLMINDPPYGMNLDTDYTQMADWASKQNGGKYENFRRKGGGSKSKVYTPVIGDQEDFDPAHIFEHFGHLDEIFLWGADYYAEHIPNRNKGGWLVWDKREDKQGGNVDTMFGSSFELCWSKKPHKRDIIRCQWAGYFGTERQDTKRRVHPTQKPLEVIQWILDRYSKINDVVIDLYLGSGTTLIAAERTGRICYGCEIEPRYADVILARWESETGQTAELLHG